MEGDYQMSIMLNRKIIQDRCGTVSFRKGDSFCRANKVVFTKYSPAVSEAIVKGNENFHVTIEQGANGSFLAKCSCPKLASFQKDCQHIAAVLLSMYEYQRNGTTSFVENEMVSKTTSTVLTEELLSLFNESPNRRSGSQLHFENRKTIEVVFTVKPILIENEETMLSIQLMVEGTMVKDIRSFLEKVSVGKLYDLSHTLSYDPDLHCFQKENDEVIRQLIEVVEDEQAYANINQVVTDYNVRTDVLLIPPSLWERILLLLKRTPSVRLEQFGNVYEGLNLAREKLPLVFSLEEGQGSDYYFKMDGLSSIIVFGAYNTVVVEGKIYQLSHEDCQKLSYLKQLTGGVATNQIRIPQEQQTSFLDKVIPGLKKLGEVQFSGRILEQINKPPLIARLYLDRLKNRLLAGLEFQYENIVINPLEMRNPAIQNIFIRDFEKEDEILALMEESSFSKTEGGYYLQNEELEYEFLYHIVPKLEKLLQIYATTAVRNRIFKANSLPKIRVRVKKERTNWLEFKFELEGIHEKHIREILAALEEKRKYYRVQNGSLMSLETREFEEIRRFLHALPDQAEDLESGLNVPIVRGLQLLETLEDSKVFLAERSFNQFLDELLHPENLNIKVPNSLEHILRDYQKLGFKWMKTLASYGFGGILGDSMGLGKTLQSITYILSELSDIREQKHPILIVAPSSLTYNWLYELKKFTPKIVAAVLDGSKSEREKLQKVILDSDVVITTYPLLRRDIHWFEKQSFHTVFFDEAQSFKNPITQTARAVKRVKADHRFALTGTPVENSIEELWSIYHVVFPELFLGIKEYSKLTNKAISRKIKPFLLRRTKEDVLKELPEKIETEAMVELLPDQKKLYAAYLAKLKEDTLKHLDKDTLRKNRIKILAGLTRLRQICCHPVLFVDGYKGSSSKFDELLKILRESKLSGRRVLVFSQFTKMLKLIGRELSNNGETYFYLDGQTPSEERIEICNRFNEGERDIFLISLKAGGTGLNLTGADTVILYDLWWNPAVEAQAADRAHRIGQENVVTVIKLVARGTIEEKMNELQQKKRHLIQELIDSDAKGSTSILTEEDIREILLD